MVNFLTCGARNLSCAPRPPPIAQSIHSPWRKPSHAIGQQQGLRHAGLKTTQSGAPHAAHCSPILWPLNTHRTDYTPRRHGRIWVDLRDGARAWSIFSPISHVLVPQYCRTYRHKPAFATTQPLSYSRTFTSCCVMKTAWTWCVKSANSQARVTKEKAGNARLGHLMTFTSGLCRPAKKPLTNTYSSLDA